MLEEPQAVLICSLLRYEFVYRGSYLCFHFSLFARPLHAMGLYLRGNRSRLVQALRLQSVGIQLEIKNVTGHESVTFYTVGKVKGEMKELG